MAPTFTGLPSELLDKIVEYSIPEGFESLAVTCKLIYAHCTRFIARHNHLRFSFREFIYRKDQPDPRVETHHLAFELLACIAAEPRVARYIVDADLRDDSDSYPTGRPFIAPNITPNITSDIGNGNPLVSLFANSSYLARAGLDWKEYYALVKQEVQRSDYSQHAAAFILTLLPNITSLTLPRQWKPSDKTDRLLEVIVREARRSRFIWNEPSLAKLTTFELISLDFNNAIPFLALPHVRSFSYKGLGNRSMKLASKNQYVCYGETLEEANFLSSALNGKEISEFLKHTPRLKELDLCRWGTGRDSYRPWDICGFVVVIESEVGSHLEGLSLSTFRRCGFMHGQASMHGFQRLRRLDCPLELAMSHENKALPRPLKPTDSLKDSKSEVLEPSISDLIPASVTKLSLIPYDEEQYWMALDVVFRDMTIKEGSKLPFLKEIYMEPPSPYLHLLDVRERERLEAKALEAGVVLHLSDDDSD
ncbi:hypothetical protein RRF57_002382 [Xylaria bambusicola]|uniref:F-box domain-containing protein n=1 Tax=Xylaria bambusicola TaxID=326684 RepID=A0AAN7UF69_9PEZI